MAGITDVFATVTVPKTEYEELVRDSERIDAVNRYINATKYPCTDDIKALLCIEKKEEIKEHSFEEMLKKAGEE